MFGNHLDEVRGLMEIYRYQGKIMQCRRSVAEHSWFVSKVAHGLAFWEKYKFGNVTYALIGKNLPVKMDISSNRRALILLYTFNLCIKF